MSNKSDGISVHRWDQRWGLMRYTGAGLPSVFKYWLERPVAGLAFYCAAILCVYLLIERLLDATFALPLSAFSSQFLFHSAVTQFGWTARILLGVFTLLVLVFDPAKLRWSDFSGGSALRFAMVSLAVLMVWPFTTYGYNYAVDASHILDRSLLLVSLLLFIWRPAFALVLLLLSYLIFAQLTAPSLGGSVLAHKTQVLRVLELFGAFYFVRLLLGYHRTSGFIFMVGCYVAVAYWLPALAKFRLDWLSNDSLNLVPLAAYAHGWRGDLTAEDIVGLGARLELIAPLFKAVALSVEAAFVLFFLRYRFAVFLLCAAIVFHIGVFYLFGFLFWTWIALDVVLIVLLIANHRAEATTDIFGLKFVPLAAVLILSGSYWAKPPALAWYDAPLTYAYTFNATLQNGEKVRLNPAFFAPYEDAFTMTGFSYLVEQHGILVGPYGVTDDTDRYLKMRRAKSFDDIVALEQAQTWRSYNKNRADRFYAFVEEFVRNRNQRGDAYQWLYKLHSPVQFWSNSGGLSRLDDRIIVSVDVVENTHFFDGETLRLERQLTLHTVDISSEP